jgi:sugar lactone lactonase YvrE
MLLLFAALLLPALASAQSKIFWDEQMVPPAGTIYSANLDGSSPQNLFPLNDLGPIRGLAVDPSNKKIYWSDSTNNRIRVSNFDGSAAATAIGSLASNPASLTVDPAAEKIYWCSEGPGIEIFRADFDGSNMETLFTPASVARGLALDVAVGKMYWAVSVSGSAKIQRGNMDGSGGIEDVIPSGLGTVSSLALDPDGGKMYWVDFSNAEIHRANLDGTAAELLVTAADLPHSIALDAAAGKMYWTDLDDGNLFRADLDGSNLETLTAAMPNRPEFMGLYIAPASTFAGMTNTSLGNASMSLDLNNHLLISNIGASGLDGVSFNLGQAQFGELDFGSTLALSSGAFVQASAIGSINNVPGQTIGSIRFTGVSGGNTNVQFDLSAVSALGPCVIVYNGPTQVFLGVVPGNSVEVAGHVGPCAIPFQPVGLNAQATVLLGGKFAISIPGGPTVTGDRIVALAENISASVEYVSDISVIGANLSSFTLEAEAIGLFDTFLHEAAGNAQITSNQQLATSQLTVSNLGASLLDGVDIDVEEAGITNPCVLVALSAVPLSGVNEQVHFSASSPAIAAFGTVDLLATGSGFNVNVDYSGIGASMVNVMVFNAGVPVGSAIVPAGTVGTITGPATLTRTFVEAAGALPCLIVGFANPVSFAFALSSNMSFWRNPVEGQDGADLGESAEDKQVP